VLRRPRVPLKAVPVIAICVANVAYIGSPLFHYGFDWIANANDDMANYVLSALDLMHHGLLGPQDLAAVTHDRNYASVLRAMHNVGSRPGADIMLGAYSATVMRPPWAAFMPLILAFNMCTVCATGALALQKARRWWAAPLAAALLTLSPLATYSVLAELMPQVWGLGLAAALFAILMREDLHVRQPGLRDAVPIALLVISLLVVYIELAAAIGGAYVLFVLVLAAQRRVAWGTVLRLWTVAIGAAFVLVNTYLVTEIQYVQSQASNGLRSTVGRTELFNYTLVPTALAAVVGFASQGASLSARFMQEAIGVALVVCTLLAVGSLISLRHRIAPAIVLVVYLFLGAVLALQTADFGLFKLYMYVQPFIAAVVAVWVSTIGRRSLLVLAAVALVAIGAAQVRTGRVYLHASRDPVDLPHASSSDLMPAFRRWYASADAPIVLASENPVVTKLAAAYADRRRLMLFARDVFVNLAAPSETGWSTDYFTTNRGRTRNLFFQNLAANSTLATGRCLLVIPTGSQLPLNRLTLPEGSPALVERPCDSTRNLLVFTWSRLGEGYFLPVSRKWIGMYQLEHDFFYRGQTFAGVGRYVLLRVLDASKTVRLELDLTTTVRQDGREVIPHASFVGSSRDVLPLVGRGSARVYSAPLKPRFIAGQAYVLLDMATLGTRNRTPRTGLEKLFGRSISYDPRYLTAYVRDVSAIDPSQYARLRAPRAIRSFPDGLANPGLEYSGLYEDGWVAERSYVMLSGGRAADLLVKADALPISGQHVRILVDGREVVSRSVAGGQLAVRAHVPASPRRRRVDIRWSKTVQLGSHDRRPAAARLSFLGLVAPRSG